MIKSDTGAVELSGTFREMTADLGCAINALINIAEDDDDLRRLVTVIVKVWNESDAIHRVMDLDYNPEADDTDTDPEEMA